MEDKMVSAAELSVLGIFGSAVAALFGGWNEAMTTLCIFMAIDYLTGLFVAIAGKSKKTKKGGLSSKVGFFGLMKKVMIMLTIIVAFRLDLLISVGATYVKDGTCIAFIINETISILENVGKFIPIPAPIQKAIDVLKNRNEDDKNDKRN